MAEVPRPVRTVLTEPVDEAGYQRMWREVRAGRARRDRDRVPLGWRAAPFATAALAALAVTAVWVEMRPAATTHTTAGALERAAGPLRLASREAPGRVAVAGTVRFEDGSHVTLAEETALRTEENSGRAFGTRMERGHARFYVRPGGPREWAIECDLARVVVVGTEFEVERTDARVRVAVGHGVVRVEDRVNDRVLTLVANESVVIERRRAAEGMGPTASSADAPPSGPAAASPGDEGAWTRLAREGEYAEAWAVLGRDGLARESRRANASELLALADVARRSGHPAEAVEPLERLLRTRPDDANAGVAAFTLGIVQMDQLRDAAAAAAAFDRALELGLPPALQENALARLAIVRGQSADAAGARLAAERYLELYPDGARRAEVRRWAAPM